MRARARARSHDAAFPKRSEIGARFSSNSEPPAARSPVAGYGEHQPVSAGNGDGAKAQNRRVEILLLQR